jgi:cob(I)alamin adenosyltransferase
MPRSEFYSRRGDDGYTGLLGPERVPKNDPRPEAYGAVDETQAVLGLVRASGCTPATSELLLLVQRHLHTLMAELAAAGQPESPFTGSITGEHVEELEAGIKRLEDRIAMPREFVLPGESQPGATLHLARTVARRAERETVRLAHDGLLDNPQLLRYLNRLSSLLFVLACFEDQIAEENRSNPSKDLD